MNRQSFIAGLVVAVLASNVFFSVAQAQEASATSDAEIAIQAAEEAVNQARVAIEKGKELIAQIPEDSPLMEDVAEVVQAASENWAVAVDSLKGSKESAAKIANASSEEISKDFALLSKVNAGVALSGAKVVQIALSYIEAIATNKTESLDIIRPALQDAMAASSQVQFNYDRVKNLITEKYSK
ncbi:hypothetical protein PDESU_04082 [Pontiella desulfatans]|uniref:Uncharacterized protein n=1 Tax=Pontiella desulfatans TaxID=2750659 RepID=A0A6C2U6M1_PONDE|nr:hypothetical protein [Pontiella desulfatans]VGO15499.1 hypothetical protein PDESU_04082 [Pontiella desulfatans]